VAGTIAKRWSLLAVSHGYFTGIQNFLRHFFNILIIDQTDPTCCLIDNLDLIFTGLHFCFFEIVWAFTLTWIFTLIWLPTYCWFFYVFCLNEQDIVFQRAASLIILSCFFWCFKLIIVNIFLNFFNFWRRVNFSKTKNLVAS